MKEKREYLITLEGLSEYMPSHIEIFITNALNERSKAYQYRRPHYVRVPKLAHIKEVKPTKIKRQAS